MPDTVTQDALSRYVDVEPFDLLADVAGLAVGIAIHGIYSAVARIKARGARRECSGPDVEPGSGGT